MRKTFLLLFLALAFFATGCQPEEPELAFTPETPLPQLTPGYEEATPTPDQTLTPTPDIGTPAPEATPTPAASPTPEVLEPDEDAYLASTLLRTEVLSRQETVLGEIRDFITDREESKVSYAVISITDSGINRERVAAVPYEALAFELRANSGYRYYLEIEVQVLENAPEINLEEIDFVDPGWDNELVMYWQEIGVLEEDEKTTTPTPTFTPVTPGARITGTTGRVPAGWVEPRYVLISVLLEAPVTALEVQPTPDPTPVRTPPPGPPVQTVTPVPMQSPTPTQTPGDPGVTPTPGQTTPTPETTPPTAPSPTPTQPGEMLTPTPEITPTATPGASFLYASNFSGSNPASLLQTTPSPPGTGGEMAVTPVPVREVGEVLGTVEDVIMDPESGEILYVLVLGENVWIPVPLDAFMVIHRERHFALEAWNVLRIERMRLAKAPGYEKGMLPDLAADGWDAGVREYWDVQ